MKVQLKKRITLVLRCFNDGCEYNILWRYHKKKYAGRVENEKSITEQSTTISHALSPSLSNVASFSTIISAWVVRSRRIRVTGQIVPSIINVAVLDFRFPLRFHFPCLVPYDTKAKRVQADPIVRIVLRIWARIHECLKNSGPPYVRLSGRAKVSLSFPNDVIFNHLKLSYNYKLYKNTGFDKI